MKKLYVLLLLLVIFASSASVAQITVKFKVPAGWSSVALYCWIPALPEPLGGWPGVVLTETDGWYSYTFDPAFTGGNLILNNNNGGQQTVSFPTSSSTCFQTTEPAVVGGEFGLTSIPCTAPGITVKFKKPAGWTEVHLYTWGPEVVGGWPGPALTETDGWFTYTFDVAFTGANLIFNNGAAEQTADYAITADVCLQSSAVVNTGGKYDVTVSECVQPLGMTVKFKKPTSWTTVSLYTYGPEATGAWPGAALTETDGWYTYTFEATYTGGNLIFNNTGSEQVEDYVMTADVCLEAASVLNANSKYDVSAVECNPTTFFTIKFKKPESWTAVSLYTWGPEAAGGWPGATLTETDGWYTYSMNSIYTGAKLIFNNAGVSEQTADFACTGDVCLAPTGLKDGSDHYIVAPTPCTTGGITVTFKKPETWTNVNLYAYVNDAPIIGSWPGAVLTEVNGVYSYTFDAAYTSVNIIYNNGTAQLADQTVTAATCFESTDGAAIAVVDCSTITAVNAIKEKSLSIYPNPVADKINFTGFENIEKVTIQSVTGKNMMSGKEISKQGSLYVKTLKSGVYIVRIIYSDGSQIARKIIKM